MIIVYKTIYEYFSHSFIFHILYVLFFTVFCCVKKVIY